MQSEVLGVIGCWPTQCVTHMPDGCNGWVWSRRTQCCRCQRVLMSSSEQSSRIPLAGINRPVEALKAFMIPQFRRRQWSLLAESRAALDKIARL